MAEGVGAGAAWRLLGTLEGGSLLLATSALLAYACARPARRARAPDVRTVLLSDAASSLGGEIKRNLELRGCTVVTVTSGADSWAASGGGSGLMDALVVVGARSKGSGLDALAGLVSEDVYENLKFLERMSGRVRAGGRVAWACGARAAGGAARAAFHDVLRAALDYAAATSQCEAVWVDGGEGGDDDDDRPQATAERLVAALLSHDVPETNAVR